MSTLTELLDRLTGVAMLREKQLVIEAQIKHLMTSEIDHEKRLLKLEAIVAAGLPQLPRPR
jgi:hypothetical protein